MNTIAELRLLALCPLDGRYGAKTELMAGEWCEMALMRCRIIVVGEYFIALSEHPDIPLRQFSQDEKSLITALYDLSIEDAVIIKAIEETGFEDIERTRHDVKAIEYYIKYKLKGTSLEDVLEWAYFALTSEDPNNLAYAMMLRGAMETCIIPMVEEIIETISRSLVETYAKDAMVARTHGQPASPTTIGKEFAIFIRRLKKQLLQLKRFEIEVKLNGASGNYNAHIAALPNVDWISFSENFIASLDKGEIGFKVNLITAQVEPHDTYAELFAILMRINTIFIDMGQDIWRYISDDWITQKAVKGETGSSAMPQKVNPIDWENAEGNFGISNALLEFFCRKLPISRLQRDLSDSTVIRNFGVAFGYQLVAFRSILSGLPRMSPNVSNAYQYLVEHPEIAAEGVQSILRISGHIGPYEALKELTRGKKITRDDLIKFIIELRLPDKDLEARLLSVLIPGNYQGLAEELARLALQ